MVCDRQEPNYMFGFFLTLVAGFASALGTMFLPLLECGSYGKVTAGALSFAAGVMLYVSFVDVLGEESKEFFQNHFLVNCAVSRQPPQMNGREQLLVRIWTAVFLFVGLALAILLDVVLSKYSAIRSQSPNAQALELSKSCPNMPSEDVPTPSTSSRMSLASLGGDRSSHLQLEQLSLVSFVALTLHNIPEGLATFLGGGTGSLTVPFAIAMHNIPEGAAIAIPCYQVSGSMLRAIAATLISGLAQPLGAALGWFLIVVLGLKDVPEFAYGAMYSMTAGIMISVSIVELIPGALETASPRFVGCGVFLGFLVMECSISMLDFAKTL